MRVKVTANITLGYGGEYHGEGAELSVLPDDLSQLAGLVEVIEPEANEAVEENTTELTIAEIKTILDGHGIEYSKRARRAELLAMLPE